MASASKAAKSRGGEGGALLKGSNLPKSVKVITLFVHSVREAPDEWSSPLVMDIDETYGCTALALNKSNTKLIAADIGDDTDAWAGYEMVFEKVRVNNPQTHVMSDGLLFQSAKKSKRKPVPRGGEVPF